MTDEIQDTPVKERYSFSKLNSWWVCPYGWKLRYIDGNVGVGNAFSSYGILVHSILERYAKGEINLWDLPQVYEWEFESSVPEKFPYNKYTDLKESYYTQGLEFLSQFSGYNDCKIIGSEMRFDIDIDDWIFNGVIDLVFEDSDGKLVIRDYKSKRDFSSNREMAEYARQLYLYSLYVKELLGRYPDDLQFLMFRKNNLIHIPFNQRDCDEAVEWAKNTVNTIREAAEYPPKCDAYYSANLCNHRNYCDLRSG